jgi:hypothetical protein
MARIPEQEYHHDMKSSAPQKALLFSCAVATLNPLNPATGVSIYPGSVFSLVAPAIV